MDIDIMSLPKDAAAAIVQGTEDVRVIRDGQPIARVVQQKTPKFRSLKSLRDRIQPLEIPSEILLREERDRG